MRVASIIGTAALAAGCASSLKSFDAEQGPVVGVPVRSPMLAEVTRVTTFAVAPNAVGNAAYAGYCKPDTAVTLEVLPIGKLYYLNFDPATFGKAEFKVDLSDAGLLKSVSLNSDPRTAETTKEIAGLLESVLPFVAAPKEAPTDARTQADPDRKAQEMRDKYCIRTGVSVRTFREARPSN